MTRFFSSAPGASAVQKPTEDHNRRELKPGTLGTPGKALFLVSLLQSLPLYVVSFGLLRLALPNSVPEAGVELEDVHAFESEMA